MVSGLCEMEKAGANIVFISKRQTSGRGKGILLGESGRSQNKHPGFHQRNISNVTFTAPGIFACGISLLFLMVFIVSQ